MCMRSGDFYAGPPLGRGERGWGPGPRAYRGLRATAKHKIYWTKNRKDGRKIYKNKQKWRDKRRIRGESGMF
jgi:hypothetical protein